MDTNTVLKRVAMSMIPRAGFTSDVCEGSIDLYGELQSTVIELTTGSFWTLTTLVLILYTTSTLTASITQYLSDPNAHITTNLPLLSTALSTVYVYGLLVPVLLWAATKWLGIGEWSIVEALGIYGYAMSVFVPIGLLCLIPVGILRWFLVGAGAVSSGFFLSVVHLPCFNFDADQHVTGCRIYTPSWLPWVLSAERWLTLGRQQVDSSAHHRRCGPSRYHGTCLEGFVLLVRDGARLVFRVNLCTTSHTESPGTLSPATKSGRTQSTDL